MQNIILPLWDGTSKVWKWEVLRGWINKQSRKACSQVKKYWYNTILNVLHYSKTGQGLKFTGNAPCCPGRKGTLMNLQNTVQIFLSGSPQLLGRKSRLRILPRANFWSVFKKFLSNANHTESKHLVLPHPTVVCETPWMADERTATGGKPFWNASPLVPC